MKRISPAALCVGVLIPVWCAPRRHPMSYSLARSWLPLTFAPASIPRVRSGSTDGSGHCAAKSLKCMSMKAPKRGRMTDRTSQHSNTAINLSSRLSMTPRCRMPGVFVRISSSIDPAAARRHGNSESNKRVIKELRAGRCRSCPQGTQLDSPLWERAVGQALTQIAHPTFNVDDAVRKRVSQSASGAGRATVTTRWQ